MTIHDSREWPPIPELAPGRKYRTWDGATQAAIVALIDDHGVPVGEVLDHYQLASSVVRNWRIKLEHDDEAPPGRQVPAVDDHDSVSSDEGPESPLHVLDDDQADDDGFDPDVCVITEFDPHELAILDALAFLNSQSRDDHVATILTQYLEEQAHDPHVVQAIALRRRWAGNDQ